MRQNGRAAPVAFFHRLRPPARIHINRRFFGASVGAVRLNHESDSTGETRQDLKIPTVSGGSLPLALSCSDPAVYRIPVPPFSLTGSVALSHSSHTGISARCRSFAPSWAVSKNSPFSPTAAPYPVTVHLSPTRKDTQKRHWQQPLVTGSSQRICLAKHAVALEVCAKVRLHWKDRFGCCALRKPVTTVKQLPN